MIFFRLFFFLSGVVLCYVDALPTVPWPCWESTKPLEIRAPVSELFLKRGRDRVSDGFSGVTLFFVSPDHQDGDAGAAQGLCTLLGVGAPDVQMG